MEIENLKSRFLLLQINDSLFPIGGYSHSYGLETYVQKGLVSDSSQAEEYIRRRLGYSFLYTDLLAVRLAYKSACHKSIEELEALENILEASRVPFELRDASRRLGSRFIKTLEKMDLTFDFTYLQAYFSGREKRTLCHPCAYGAVCACAGVALKDALLNYLYAQASAMVTNCVKLIPLSQSEGQRILADLYPLFEEILSLVREAGLEMLCVSAPAFDLRSIQHETLYSRLYMS